MEVVDKPTATPTDKGHARLLWVALLDAPSSEAGIQLLGDALAAARRAFAEAVNATADEYGMEMEESCERLCELLQHEFSGGDQSEYGRFAAESDNA